MWHEQDNKLYRKFIFQDFNDAFNFITKVAALAEKMKHHPSWSNTYNVVEIWLSTHETHSISAKDYKFAEAIDKLFGTNEIKNEKSSNSTTVDNSTTKLTDIKLYTDGGSRGNPGPSAAAFVIMDKQDNVVEKVGKYIGVTTNNQAEYQALRHGLERSLQLNPETVQVFMDSLLVVNQVNGIYKVKNRDLWPIFEKIQQVKVKFKKITFHHVPREFNKLADGEVNRILDEQ